MVNSDKKSIISDITKNTTSNLFVKAMNFIQGLFVANILGPVLFGVKNAISLIYDYGINAHLGVIFQHNIERNTNEIKDRDYANKITDTTFSFLLFLSGFILIILAIIAYIIPYSLTVKLSVFIIGLAIVFYLFNYLYSSIFASKREFGILAKWNIINGILALVCVVPLTYYFKIFGFFLGLAISSFLSVLYLLLIKKKIYSPKLNIDVNIYWTLLKNGFFILIIQLFWLVLLSIDRIFVLKFFGTEMLGYYAIGLFFSGYVRFLIQLVSVPLTPRIYQKPDKELVKYIVNPNRYIYSGLYYLIIVTIFLIPFIIFIFPKYGNSVNFIKILVFSTIFMPDLALQYFLSKRKNWFIIKTIFIFIVLLIGLNFWFISLEFKAIGIAIATLITLFLYSNTINFYCYAALYKSFTRSLIELWKYLWPLIYAVVGYVLIWGLFQYWGYNFINYYFAKIIQVILFTIWYLPILIKIEKESSILKLLFKRNNLNKE